MTAFQNQTPIGTTRHLSLPQCVTQVNLMSGFQDLLQTSSKKLKKNKKTIQKK